MNRDALSAPSESIAPPRKRGSLAITPTVRPSTRISDVTMPRANSRRSSSTHPVSDRVSTIARTSYTRRRFSGMICRMRR